MRALTFAGRKCIIHIVEYCRAGGLEIERMRKTKIETRKKRLSGFLAAAAAAAMALAFCGCGEKSKTPLDPDHPVSLTVWHYYNGSQQAAFDALVEEFNETEGREKGIYVQGNSYGSVSDLETAVRDSLAGRVGAEEMPDIFSSYADTAYEVDKAGALVDLSDYLSQEELEQYVDSYIEEGRIAADGSLRIFPIAKSTEITMVNKTEWDEFAQETGASLEALATMEGIADTARAYYEWVDAKTPDIPYDGRAFYGRDAMANYFIIGMRQQGREIFQAEGGQVTLNTDKECLRRIWDNYYVPFVKGYYGAYGSFRSDDVKTGDLIAYTGSTTSAMYFPDRVEAESESHDIDYIVLSAPVMEGGENYAVQQGAGMVVSRSDERQEYAAVEFLKWFTRMENNLQFCSAAGYLPVLKEAGSTEALDGMLEDRKMEIKEKTYACITHVFDKLPDMKFYTNKSFENGSQARAVLEHNLQDKAAADRAAVEAALLEGKSLEEACEPFLTEEAFETWYAQFCTALNEAAGK